MVWCNCAAASARALSLLTRAAEQLPDAARVLFALGFAYLQK